MKKLLILLVSVIFVFSLATVSMAASTIKGDFRYELYNITDPKSDLPDNSYDNADLRVILDGNVSDSVNAHLQMRMQTGKSTLADEYWFQCNEKFGTLRLGNWDWKTTPSRVLLKSHGFNIFPRSDGTLAVDVPLGGFYTGLAVALDRSSDFDAATLKGVNDNAYDVKLGFKAKAVGVEAHYFDTQMKDSHGQEVTNIALDAWCKPTDNMKIYAYGNDYSVAYKGIDSYDPVLGVQFTNMFGLKLNTSLEYALDPRRETKGKWNEYAVQMQYTFSNKVVGELEYTDFWGKTNHVEKKLVLRGKFAF